MTSAPAFLNPLLVDDLVRRALDEDLGRAGDITSDACLPPGATATAVIAARAPGVVAGLPFAAAAFRLLDPSAGFRPLVADGATVAAGERIAGIVGPARALLAGERVALNFLGRLSGIATLTAAYVDAVRGTRARIACTRKTTPGLRAAEKWAVRMGGGSNHRYGLDDAVLIKDNHVAVCGGVAPALRRAKAAVGHLVRIEVEVDTLVQLEEALAEGADVVLLDNMDAATLARAVAMVGGRMVTEASGGVSLETVRAVALAGVDLISVGALTHSARVLDLGLDVVIGGDHDAGAGPA